MINTKQLQLEVTNNHQSIKSIDVTYLDGKTVSGFPQQVMHIPFEVTLCKHETPKGEDSCHYLEFDDAVSITLVFQDGESKVFV